ncbi:MAG: hypothetical protein QOJ65_1186 [Fimbriimonadaceae bacterium]|jgi:HAD superfamily hydrolase (TIGR01509 family)|nr:hypothetical protein [Fimbriimonadaceae bacterium]
MSREPSLSDYKAVLFDVDGTLVDSMDKIVNGLGDALQHFTNTRPPDQEIRQLIGLPLSIQFKRYAKTEPTRAELDDMIRYTISRYEYHHDLERVFEPAIEALKLCHKAGLKTALVTSKNAQEMDLFFSRFVGRDYVDATVCASDVSKPKPDPECVKRACELLAVSPDEALLVGDAIFDMQSARAAGVTPVAVAYGSVPASVLSQENPSMILETPEDLLAWTRRSLLQPTCPERNRP